MTEVKQKMNEILKHFQHDIAALRTGRASPAVLQNIKVNLHGQFVPIHHVGHVTVMDHNTLCVRVWDTSAIVAVEAAIGNSDLGVTPKLNGQDVIVSIPTMTQERREKMCKILMDMGEHAKIKIRNIRRHDLDQLREECKNGEISEDDMMRLKQSLQKDTDDCVNDIDKLVQDKKQEIMTV